MESQSAGVKSVGHLSSPHIEQAVRGAVALGQQGLRGLCVARLVGVNQQSWVAHRIAREGIAVVLVCQERLSWGAVTSLVGMWTVGDAIALVQLSNLHLLEQVLGQVEGGVEWEQLPERLEVLARGEHNLRGSTCPVKGATRCELWLAGAASACEGMNLDGS